MHRIKKKRQNERRQSIEKASVCHHNRYRCFCTRFTINGASHSRWCFWFFRLDIVNGFFSLSLVYVPCSVAHVSVDNVCLTFKIYYVVRISHCQWSRKMITHWLDILSHSLFPSVCVCLVVVFYSLLLFAINCLHFQCEWIDWRSTHQNMMQSIENVQRTTANSW